MICFTVGFGGPASSCSLSVAFPFDEDPCVLFFGLVSFVEFVKTIKSSSGGGLVLDLAGFLEELAEAGGGAVAFSFSFPFPFLTIVMSHGHVYVL